MCHPYLVRTERISALRVALNDLLPSQLPDREARFAAYARAGADPVTDEDDAEALELTRKYRRAMRPGPAQVLRPTFGSPAKAHAH